MDCSSSLISFSKESKSSLIKDIVSWSAISTNSRLSLISLFNLLYNSTSFFRLANFLLILLASSILLQKDSSWVFFSKRLICSNLLSKSKRPP